MLTPEQQQQAVVWLIVVVAVVAALALLGSLLWYLVFTKGFAPLALVLLLPILWATAIFAPFIWLLGASIQHWDAAQEAPGRAWPAYAPGSDVSAATPQPQTAPAKTAPPSVSSDRDISRELGPADRTPVPTT